VKVTHWSIAATIATTLVAASHSANAQSDSVDVLKVVQFTIPATPALAFIGTTSEKITQPTTPKDIAAMIANGIDASGHVVQGLAGEIAFRKIFLPNLDVDGYRKFWPFILANTALSAGTVKVAGDTSSTNIGLGLRVTLFDRSDPMTTNAHVLDAVHACSPDGPVPDDPTKLAAFKKCFAAADSQFATKFRKDHWNDFALTLAAATGWQLGQSELSQHQAMGMSVSALLAAPLCLGASKGNLCDKGQWLFQGGYEQRDSILGAPTSSRRLSYGVRGTIGSDKVGVFAEIVGTNLLSDAKPGQQQHTTDWSGGIEGRVSDNVWVSTGLGSRYNELVAKNKAVLIAGVRMNLAGSQQFKAIVPGTSQ